MTENKYPKEIITIEKITDDSTEETEVKTLINNEYEENATKVAISFQDRWNHHDLEGMERALNFPHARVGADGKLLITEDPPILPKRFFKWFIKTTGWNHST